MRKSCSDCVGVCLNVCCVAGVVKDVVFEPWSGEVCCVFVFCLNFMAWTCRCSRMGSISVSSCICCMLVSCVYSMAVFNVAFCMTCSLFRMVEDTRGDHMEDAYFRVGIMTAL